MSCPDGVALAAYAAGDLAPLERRDVEVHLVRCRECRAHVLGLREAEARDPGAKGVAAHAPASSERGFALGFLIALAVVALGLAALGRIGDGGFSQVRLSGVYGMLFDLVFFVRGRAPGVLELVAALAATASVAAIAVLGVGSLARRLGRPLLLTAALAGALAVPADAFDLRHSEGEVRVPAGEVVAGSLIVSGAEVWIEGRVEGDLMVAGERVRITGTIAGNVFAWARELDVSGHVEGSLHAASEILLLGGAVDGSGYLAAEKLLQAEGGRITRDACLFAWGADLAGEIGRDVYFWGESLALRGRIARDLHVSHADRLEIRDGARIGRDLRASVSVADAVVIAPGAQIAGARDMAQESESMREQLWRVDPWLWLLVRIAAALAFGVALYAFLPSLFRVRVPTASSFLRFLGLGLAALVVAPFVLLLLAATLIGLPLALLGFFAYVTALYLAHVLAAAELGRTLLRRQGQDLPGLGSFARILLVGLVAIGLAGQVPVLGPAVHVVILLAGLGLLADQVSRATRSQRSA